MKLPKLTAYMSIPAYQNPTYIYAHNSQIQKHGDRIVPMLCGDCIVIEDQYFKDEEHERCMQDSVTPCSVFKSRDSGNEFCYSHEEFKSKTKKMMQEKQMDTSDENVEKIMKAAANNFELIPGKTCVRLKNTAVKSEYQMPNLLEGKA